MSYEASGCWCIHGKVLRAVGHTAHSSASEDRHTERRFWAGMNVGLFPCYCCWCYNVQSFSNFISSADGRIFYRNLCAAYDECCLLLSIYHRLLRWRWLLPLVVAGATKAFCPVHSVCSVVSERRSEEYAMNPQSVAVRVLFLKRARIRGPMALCGVQSCSNWNKLFEAS